MVVGTVVQQMDDGGAVGDEDDECDCGSNVATMGVVVKLMIDPTSNGGVGELLLQLLLMLLVVVVVLLLLLLLLLLMLLWCSPRTDHVVSHVVLQVQSVVGMTGA